VFPSSADVILEGIATTTPHPSRVGLAGVVDRAAARRAEERVARALERARAVTIDLAGVDEVNGALLGLLLRASRRAAQRGGRLYVVGADGEVRRGLETAGIDDLATVVG
jgi:anti-anti-sigma factor